MKKDVTCAMMPEVESSVSEMEEVSNKKIRASSVFQIQVQLAKSLLEIVREGKNTKNHEELSRNFFDYLQEHFPGKIEVEESLKDCDLVLGNHQGHKGAKGGVETLVLLGLTGQRTIVLKDSLLKIPGMKNLDHIPVHRPDSNLKRKDYVSKFRTAREDVAKKVFETIDNEGKVFLYPEGTRSKTGKLKSFTQENFEQAILLYIIPRIKDVDSLNWGILLSDTLKSMPTGMIGPMYDKPMSFKSIKVDFTEVIEALKRAGVTENTQSLDLKNLKKITSIFQKSVHRQMEEGLQKMGVDQSRKS